MDQSFTGAAEAVGGPWPLSPTDFTEMVHAGFRNTSATLRQLWQQFAGIVSYFKPDFDMCHIIHGRI